MRAHLAALTVLLAVATPTLALAALPVPPVPVAPPVDAKVGTEALGQEADAALSEQGVDLAVALDGSALPVEVPAVQVLLPGIEVAAQPEASSSTGSASANQVWDGMTNVPPEIAAPAAAGGLAVMAAFALRFLGLGAGLPFVGRFFSRIEGPKVLHNPQRARLHDLVTARPGSSLDELRAAADVAWGTAVHHLRRLEAHGLVVSHTAGGHRRFFIANTPAARSRETLAVISHATAHRIARLVHDEPGIAQGQVCARLGLQAPAASKHLGRFAEHGLVTVGVEGRSRRYVPTPALTNALALAAA